MLISYVLLALYFFLLHPFRFSLVLFSPYCFSLHCDITFHHIFLLFFVCYYIVFFMLALLNLHYYIVLFVLLHCSSHIASLSLHWCATLFMLHWYSFPVVALFFSHCLYYFSHDALVDFLTLLRYSSRATLLFFSHCRSSHVGVVNLEVRTCLTLDVVIFTLLVLLFLHWCWCCFLGWYGISFPLLAMCKLKF